MKWREMKAHRVHSQCIFEMLCSLNANVVAMKIERCECLHKIKIIDEGSDGKKLSLTVFSSNALAKYRAPSAPMLVS